MSTGFPKTPSIRRILVPTDLTPESAHALDHARLLQSRLGSHVTLYHALEMPGREWARAAGHEEELRRRLAAQAALELERQGRSLPGPFDVVVEPDVSAPALLVDVALRRFIQATQPDLIVMGTHSRGAMNAFFLGSVTQEILRHAGRPVLAVGPGCAAPARGYERIVLPTDLSDASREAFPIAVLFARAFEARVTALHAVPRPLLTALAANPHALAAAVPSTSTGPRRVRGRARRRERDASSRAGTGLGPHRGRGPRGEGRPHRDGDAGRRQPRRSHPGQPDRARDPPRRVSRARGLKASPGSLATVAGGQTGPAKSASPFAAAADRPAATDHV